MNLVRKNQVFVLAFCIAAQCLDIAVPELSCNITIFGGPAAGNTPCEFPFVFNRRRYKGCTIAMESGRRPWCPTKVSKRRRKFPFGSNHWGYCDPRCPFQDASGNDFTGTTATTVQSTRAITSPPTTVKVTTVTTTTTTTALPSTQMTTTRIVSSTTRAKTDNSSYGTWIPNRKKNECGRNIQQSYIFGGVDSYPGEFPFIALLGYTSLTTKRRYDYLCGGALINRRYVLTAAHCHKPQKPIKIVVLGEFDIEKEMDCSHGCMRSQEIEVDPFVRVHPDYYFNGYVAENDIALVRLKTLAITLEQDIRSLVSPACLPYPYDDDMTTRVTVIGWGKVSRDPSVFWRSGVGSTKLQKLDMNLVSRKDCLTHFTRVSRHQICAGGVEGEDSCNGDSGGPLVYRQDRESPIILKGIVSSGTLTCGIGKPGLYTNVMDFIDWIKANLED